MIHLKANIRRGGTLMIVETNAPKRGKWGGYVSLRVVEAPRDANESTPFGPNHLVHFQGLGNRGSMGARSAYGKAMADAKETFDEILAARGEVKRSRFQFQRGFGSTEMQRVKATKSANDGSAGA